MIVLVNSLHILLLRRRLLVPIANCCSRDRSERSFCEYIPPEETLITRAGAQKTVECRHDKLVGLQVYSDAISINVSNRQNASMFRVEDGPFVAAMINAAVQAKL